MEKNLILLINDLLYERKDYISTRDIHEYAFSHGWNLERNDKWQKDSVRQQITQAKNKLRECLGEHGLQLEEIPDEADGRCMRFRYPSEVFEREIDLVAKFRKGYRRLRKQQIEEMMACSKGLLPRKVMAEVFLKELDRKQRALIEFDGNHELKNIHLLSELFLAIRNKEVVTFVYAPFASEKFSVVLHPHYLKEFNNRWFVFGLSFSRGKMNPAALYPLDRIENMMKADERERYKEPEVNYDRYFDSIVGVSKTKGKARRIVFRTNDRRVHGRILTKKIHRSQVQIDEWDDERQCGRFELTVRINPELKTKLLSFGNGITVEGPESFVREMEGEIRQMLISYGNT